MAKGQYKFIQFIDPQKTNISKWYINEEPPEGFTNANTDWQKWGVQSDGNIQLTFPLNIVGPVDVQVLVSRRYDPKQMPTILHIMGAIRTFYQSPMTTEDAQLLLARKDKPGPWALASDFLNSIIPAPTYEQGAGGNVFVSGLIPNISRKPINIGIYRVEQDNPRFPRFPTFINEDYSIIT